jgi:fatty-acyl-CoA synthase
MNVMERASDPLTPTSYLDRAAIVRRDDLALVEGDLRLSYEQLRNRCLRQAGMLRATGVRPGDRVAVLAPNSRMMLESHYGVLYAGAVLVPLNFRLSAQELAYIVGHAGANVLICDQEFQGTAAVIQQSIEGACALKIIGEDYEQLILASEPLSLELTDELSLMAINYTSGTTGRPKGVMYNHRGAYLQALAMKSQFELASDSVYLWTLPMFHCNGWCFTWAVTAAGATHLCLRRPEPGLVWDLIRREGVTHFCAAPTVLMSLVSDPAACHVPAPGVSVAVGGAPPSPTLLGDAADLGLSVTHLYGLTETYGPIVICEWRREWDQRSPAEQASLIARQGVSNVVSAPARVVDPADRDVAHDGASVGEVILRGNTVTPGYFKDEAATRTSMRGGWLRTGDLAVVHPDGYLEIRDRKKDVIVSGGENISSVEVEIAIATHPAVLEVAVIPVPDEKWGERPMAWVTLKADQQDVSALELQAHVRTILASFKVPDRIEFGSLPKTASGKIRKFELVQQAWGGRPRIAEGTWKN